MSQQGQQGSGRQGWSTLSIEKADKLSGRKAEALACSFARDAIARSTQHGVQFKLDQGIGYTYLP